MISAPFQKMRDIKVNNFLKLQFEYFDFSSSQSWLLESGMSSFLPAIYIAVEENLTSRVLLFFNFFWFHKSKAVSIFRKFEGFISYILTYLKFWVSNKNMA